MKLFWTDTALRQLEDLFAYYKVTVSLSIARKVSASIVDKTLLLESQPQLGQREELLKERTNEYRYLVESNYKFIYWVEDKKKQINIAAIFDCRQNPVKMQEIE